MSTETAPPSVPATEPSAINTEKKAVSPEAQIASSAVSPVNVLDSKTTTIETAPLIYAEKTSQSTPAENKAVENEAKSSTDASVAIASPEKTDIPTPTPLSKLTSLLPSIIEEAAHSEIWGVQLSTDERENHVPTSIVLEKFLRANEKDVHKARYQLIKALKWRKEVNPRKLLDDVEFDEEKFGGLGYVTVYELEGGRKEIVTWNIYGAVKDKSKTFGNVEEFIKWRSALMELSVRELNLAAATVPIPPAGEDPYRMVQVHDYLNVSFLRMDPIVKAASKEVISVFSMAYPELLKEKFFVNVPVLMGWVFAGLKLFMSPETVKKFHPLSYGSSLAGELGGWGEKLPKEYGGKGGNIKDGLSVKYAVGGESAVKE